MIIFDNYNDKKKSVCTTLHFQTYLCTFGFALVTPKILLFHLLPLPSSTSSLPLSPTSLFLAPFFSVFLSPSLPLSLFLYTPPSFCFFFPCFRFLLLSKIFEIEGVVGSKEQFSRSVQKMGTLNWGQTNQLILFGCTFGNKVTHLKKWSTTGGWREDKSSTVLVGVRGLLVP